LNNSKKERDEAILRAESLEQQKKELEVKLAQLSLKKKNRNFIRICTKNQI
jgi:hypothetical protein